MSDAPDEAAVSPPDEGRPQPPTAPEPPTAPQPPIELDAPAEPEATLEANVPTGAAPRDTSGMSNEPGPSADTEPREMAPTTWGGNVLAPRESGEEPGPEPPRRGRLGLEPMQWRYVLVMFVTGLSVVITLAIFLLIIKLVAG
jgi:hypothetical protein